jgi:uncharacterized protein (TIGR02145 family)
MRLTLTTLALLFSAMLFAQAPALIPYQAIARNAAGEPLASSTLNARFTIHDGTATGANVWQELQTVSTSTLGLFTAQLGSSVALTNVNWASGAKFMQVELDLGSGFVDIGTQQLLSVPYALYAGDAPDEQQLSVSLIGDTLFLDNGGFVVIPGISAANIVPDSCVVEGISNPQIEYGSVSDIEGNVYRTFIFNNKEWMSENLRTAHFANGELIPNVQDNNAWIQLETPAYCNYENNPNNDCPYGKLYNWYAAIDERNICPSGWHVSTETEFALLQDALVALAPGNGGGALKSTSTALWPQPNAGAINLIGFDAIPSGFRSNSGGGGSFGDLGGAFWILNLGVNHPTFRFLLWNLTTIENQLLVGYYNYFDQYTGAAIRCVRD